MTNQFNEYERRPLRDRLRDSWRSEREFFCLIGFLGILGLSCTLYAVYLMATVPI